MLAEKASTSRTVASAHQETFSMARRSPAAAQAAPRSVAASTKCG